MKVQSIFYIDYYNQMHPTGQITLEALTNREIVLKLRKLLEGTNRDAMYSIQAFSDNGRFFLVNRKSFIVTFVGQFEPTRPEIKTEHSF